MSHDSLTRRNVLRALLAAAATSSLTPVLTSCTPSPRAASLVVAGGESGGFYLEFATLLADSLQRHQVAARATVQITDGSLDNVQKLLNGEATLAVALADAASLTAGPASTHGGKISALGRVYENYVHALVRKDSPISSINDLAGRTVAVGTPGSGTSLITPRLFDVAKLPTITSGTSSEAVTVLPLGLNDGLAALAKKSVDALFWCGGVPTASITQMHAQTPFTLLDLSGLLPGLSQEYGIFYDKVLIPANSYAGMDAVWSIGVANLLLCRSDLDDATVKATVNLLVGHGDELIPRSSAGVQFLSSDTLINTADIPLHPAAAAAYRELHG